MAGEPGTSLATATHANLDAEHAALRDVRERVMNVVGHALRTPMATVRGQVEVLARTTDEDQREAVVEGLLRSTRRLERLLDDVLVAAGIETRLPVRSPEPVVLADAVRAAWGEHAHGADRELVVAGDTAARATVPPDGLPWLLRHLLDNALRYGTGPVEADVVHDGATTTLRLGTAGQELPPGDRERAFELFWRGEQAVMTSAARMGVGLTVACRLARAMGGDVTLDARDGGGTVAVVTLPAG